MGNLTRRTVLGGLAAAPLFATLVACSNGNSNPGASGDNSVIVVTDADPDTLNPGLTTNYQCLDIQSKIFDGLVWLNPQGQPQPALATEWKASDDGLTYDFTLRSGVMWHDGKPFTSADVKFSLTEGLAGNARAATIIDKIKQIDTPSDTQVTFTLTEPYAPFLIQMKVFDAPILPQHIFAGSDPKSNPASRAPIGTGPFKFSEWQAGQNVTLVANPDYFGGAPKVDSVIFKIITEPQNRINAIVTGEVDILPAIVLPTANIKDLEGKPDVEIHKQISIPALHFMQMNHSNPVLGKVEVRQALAQAIDRARMVDQAMGGLAKSGYGSFGEGFPWMVNKDSSYATLYPFDAAAAKAKIEAAGAAGTTLRLTFDSARLHFQTAGQIIKDNLAGLGITVTLEPLETSVLRERLYAQRDFDLALTSFTSSGDPAIGYHRIYRSNTERAVNINPTGYSNPEVDQLLTAAGKVSDQAARGASYAQAQALLDKDVPVLILFDEQQADVNLKRVTGLYEGQNPSDRFSSVSVTQ